MCSFLGVCRQVLIMHQTVRTGERVKAEAHYKQSSGFWQQTYIRRIGRKKGKFGELLRQKLQKHRNSEFLGKQVVPCQE